MSFSRVALLSRTRRGWVSQLRYLPTCVRAVALVLLCAGLAGPLTYQSEDLAVEGIDVVISFDVSASMTETDIGEGRLTEGKKTIKRFLAGRTGDRVGLVVFAKGAMVSSPLTLDYSALEQVLSQLEIGDVPAQGTATGDGLGLALALLRRSDSKSRVVILVSDGDETQRATMGAVEAARLARSMDVRVFTILMGGDGVAAPGERVFGVDEELLKQVARDTGGQFFRAGDDESLVDGFENVREELETSRQRVVGQRPDQVMFSLFVWPALALLLLELLMTMTRWRRFP